MSIGPFVLLLAAFATLQSQPAFRSGIDLIRLDVSVMDRNGVPVRDLRAEDFVVKVDGNPRKVSFVRFYGPAEQASPLASLRPPSFASNAEASRGRVVVIAVDVESMEAGHEKGVLNTAGALVDQLGPADLVALVPIPGKGIDLTLDRRRVREALQRLSGFRTTGGVFQHTISIKEAEAIVKERSQPSTPVDEDPDKPNPHRPVTTEVLERECLATPLVDKKCGQYIVNFEAPQVLIEADRRIQSVLHTMSDLNASLARIDAPKTLVLISAGLPFRQDMLSLFTALHDSAAAAGTSTYVIQLDQPETDASHGGLAGGVSLPRADLMEGLSTIAGVSGGTFRAGVSRAVGVFDEIRAEIMHTYQLGVESVAADADGKVHAIDVQVNRPGAVARARREIVVSAHRLKPRNVIDVLNEPTGLAELPMSATAYATLGDAPPDLKVVLLVETHVPGDRYAVRVANDERTVFETSDALSPYQTGSRVIIAAQVPAGRYSLRAAAMDGQGRAGSVELPVVVALHEAGLVQCSDLILGTAEDRFSPANYVPTGKPVTALLDLYAADPAHFNGVSVELELRNVGSDTALARVASTINETTADRRRIAQGTFDPATLPAGSYVVSAIVKREGQTLVTVSRNFVWR